MLKYITPFTPAPISFQKRVSLCTTDEIKMWKFYLIRSEKEFKNEKSRLVKVFFSLLRFVFFLNPDFGSGWKSARILSEENLNGKRERKKKVRDKMKFIWRMFFE